MAGDITERMEAERELHRQKEKYRNVVDNAQSVILQMDLDGYITLRHCGCFSDMIADYLQTFPG